MLLKETPRGRVKLPTLPPWALFGPNWTKTEKKIVFLGLNE